MRPWHGAISCRLERVVLSARERMHGWLKFDGSQKFWAWGTAEGEARRGGERGGRRASAALVHHGWPLARSTCSGSRALNGRSSCRRLSVSHSAPRPRRPCTIPTPASPFLSSAVGCRSSMSDVHCSTWSRPMAPSSSRDTPAAERRRSYAVPPRSRVDGRWTRRTAARGGVHAAWRVAATSVAERVAEEMGVPLGGTVGIRGALR